MTGQFGAAIFDHHQHVGWVGHIVGDSDPGGMPAASLEGSLAADFAMRVAAMDRLGVAQAALMPAHSYPRSRGLADTRAVNDHLAAYRRRDPQRFPAVIGTVEPRYGPAGLAEIDRMGGELRFQGVSWHHRQQGMPINHPVMVEYVQRMDELGLVPFIHTYVGGDFEEIWRLVDLASQFPSVTFLSMDAMTERVLFEEALIAGRLHKNLVFDTTSLALGVAAIERFVEELGADRLLYGSNLYSMASPDHVPGLDAIREARISEQDRRRILGENARRLLGITAE